ncbi:MAG TPA: hypothetical protein PLT70_05135, partial [bacterium]|nr:hypothetical protein [bacterium]
KEIKYCDLVHPFIISLCSSIELTISDIYIDFMFKKIGKKYKNLVRPLLKMPINIKLPLITLLVSDYKYRLNEDSKEVKYLYKLFSLRNRFVHIEEHWVDVTMFKDSSKPGIEIEYYNPKDEYYYLSDVFPELSMNNINEMYEFVKNANLRLRNLHGKVKHWKWKPEPWFIKLDKK